MGISLVQVAAAGDSTLARDLVVNTFHLSDVAFTDWDDLAQDTCELWQLVYGSTRQIETRIYDTDAAPNFPKGRAIVNEGVAPVSGFPREVACCLSYYGERNLPRQRGRIYFCLAFMGASMAGGVRPGTTLRQLLLTQGEGIANLGGADIDWVTYSRTTQENHGVTNMWVDDEWDTIRSRGLRATTRDTGTVDEG